MLMSTTSVILFAVLWYLKTFNFNSLPELLQFVEALQQPLVIKSARALQQGEITPLAAVRAMWDATTIQQNPLPMFTATGAC